MYKAVGLAPYVGAVSAVVGLLTDLKYLPFIWGHGFAAVGFFAAFVLTVMKARAKS